MKTTNLLRSLAAVLISCALCTAADQQPATTTVHGFVLDSACAFTKNLKKPVSENCARECARAGSPLVILSDAGDVYWPISEKMPAKSQNTRLMPFAGKRVTVTGRIYSRDGSRAIAIQRIE